VNPEQLLTRASGLLSVVLGLGFGLPACYGAWYFSRHGIVWRWVLGFPIGGDGPFVRWGLPNSTGLMVLFVVVCAAEVAVGLMLWRGSPTSLWLALGLLPLELVCWIGFALSFGFPLAVARTVLVVVALLNQHRGPGRRRPGTAGHAPPRPGMSPERVLTKAAGLFSAVNGLGFGLPACYGAWYFARHGFVWRGGLGYPTNGDGPFVDWGLPNSTALMAAFVAVCAAGVAVGGMLWRGSPTSLWLALGLLPIELVFWVGFALPYAFPMGVTRTVLVVVVLLDQHVSGRASTAVPGTSGGELGCL
jgi:hypothetical protein